MRRPGARGRVLSTGAPLAAPSPGPTPVTFAWDAVGGASYYMLEIGTSASATNVTNTTTGRPDLALVYHLFPGVYYWRVRAVVAGVLGSPSDEMVVHVPAA